MEHKIVIAENRALLYLSPRLLEQKIKKTDIMREKAIKYHGVSDT